MGNWNSGRRPQPTALKVLRGNPGRRRLNAHEPHMPPADAAMDTPPPELVDDSAAAAEWRRVVPMLRGAGAISQSERAALIALCQQWSRYLAAHAQVSALGMVIEVDTKRGITLTASPYLSIADHALTHCHKLWTELGLTPSGRTRISKLPAPAEEEKKSKWEGLLT